MRAVAGVTLLAAASALAAAACSSTSTSPLGAGAVGVEATTDLGASDPGPGGLRFAASGEALALRGYAFPPAQPDDAAFVDGWEVKFAHVLTTIGEVTVSDNPDRVPGDESKTGPVLARLAGPWAVDLARSEPSYLPGKGGPGELAVPFASLRTSALKTDGTRYALGFDLVAASAAAKRVNLDAGASADYEAMSARGCSVLYVGTATFKGNKADPACYPADRQDFPDVVDFWLCFRAPTTYANCQNADNDPARPFSDEEHQRGLALKDDVSVIAQVTVHTDHPFWDSVVHDAPLHFDPYAARVSGRGDERPTVTLEMTQGVDYTSLPNAAGAPLAWRYCIEPGTSAHGKFEGGMRLDPQSVPHARGGDPASGLRDQYDFATYNQSTAGHLNADGLCAVLRDYPSPR
jgi:hypothetical protein